MAQNLTAYACHQVLEVLVALRVVMAADQATPAKRAALHLLTCLVEDYPLPRGAEAELQFYLPEGTNGTEPGLRIDDRDLILTGTIKQEYDAQNMTFFHSGDQAHGLGEDFGDPEAIEDVTYAIFEWTRLALQAAGEPGLQVSITVAASLD